MSGIRIVAANLKTIFWNQSIKPLSGFDSDDASGIAIWAPPEELMNANQKPNAYAEHIEEDLMRY